MTSPRTRLAAFGIALGVAGCIEISSPTSDIESVTPVLAAYPAVIAGDTLRDSLGVAQPLRVLAFTGHGDTVLAPDGLRWFMPDTGVDAVIRDDWFIAGAQIGAVRVFGQVAGVQTPPETLYVVPVPVRALPDPAGTGSPVTVAPLRYPTDGRTIASVNLAVRVQGDTSGVPADVTGWIVTYRIVRQPAAAPGAGQIAAYFNGTQGREPRADSSFSLDTTASGIAGRAVTLNPLFLENFLTQVDTIVVEATVRLHGADVPGSPIAFRIPIEPRR